METRTWLFIALLVTACIPLILADGSGENGETAPASAAGSGEDGETAPASAAGSGEDGETAPASAAGSGEDGETAPASAAGSGEDGESAPASAAGSGEDSEAAPASGAGSDHDSKAASAPGSNAPKESSTSTTPANSTTPSSSTTAATDAGGERVETSTEEVETVTKKEFDIIGVRMKSYLGRNFNAFCGIPYADSPGLQNRFKKPILKQYDGPIDATNCEETPVCMQIRWHKDEKEIIGVEDCLFLNVYEPEVTTTNMPVIVYIHGGGFFAGSGTFNDVGPHYFMDQDVVLVTINYRLGPLGFFCLDERDSPCNLGMYDQHMALKWVHTYIRYFHGDLFRVTLMGEGAGGASVHLHLYSPMSSKELFHSAISQSGVAYNSWALTNDIVKTSKAHATILDCYKGSTAVTMKCMRKLDAAAIVNSTGGLHSWLLEPLVIYRPTVEHTLHAKNVFLPRDPLDILMDGRFNKVPWLVGTVNMPGFFHIQRYLQDEKLRSSMLHNFEKYGSQMLDLHTSIPDNETLEAALETIKAAYTELTGGFEREALVQIFNDREGNLGQMLAVAYHALVGHDKVYQYRFDYRGMHSMAENITGVKEDEVVNEDDLIYLLRRPNLFPDFDRTQEEGKRDFQMMRKLTAIWAEFAATGEVKALHRGKRATPEHSQAPNDTGGAVTDNSGITISSVTELMQVDKGGENASEPPQKRARSWQDFVDLEWKNKSSCWDKYANIVWPAVKRFPHTPGNVPMLPYLSFRKGGNDTPIAYCLQYLMEFDRLNHWLQLPLMEVRMPEDVMMLVREQTTPPERSSVMMTTGHHCPVYTTPGLQVVEEVVTEEPQPQTLPPPIITWPSEDFKPPVHFPEAPVPVAYPTERPPLSPTERPPVIILEEPEEAPPEMDEEQPEPEPEPEEPEEVEPEPETVSPEQPKYSWPRYPKPPPPPPPQYPQVDFSLPPPTPIQTVDVRPFPVKPTPVGRPTSEPQYFTWWTTPPSTEKSEVNTEKPQKPQKPQRPTPHRPKPHKKPKSSAPPRSREVCSYTSLLLLLLLVVQF